jgi:non-ribosomal peptide synthetase component E (peptide arylation enzyme)
MRVYTVKGQDHKVYDLESELPDKIVINPDWKNSRVGDWVRADDDAYIQVLDRKKMGKIATVVTCIGTYSPTGTMDTAERENRTTLNGLRSDSAVKKRKNLTQREILFAKRISLGEKPMEAYLAVYDAKSREYANRRAALLMKTKRVDTFMNQDLKDTFVKKGVDLDYLIQQAKDECDNSKNGSDRISALKMLWEAWGVVEKQKVTEITGIFQGFDKKRLEEAKRPELPEHQGDETV